MKYLLLIPCLWCFTVQAQTKAQIDSIRNVVTQELTPKIAQELSKEVPADLICYNNKKTYSVPVFIIHGYIKGGQYLDSKHRPVPEFITVLQAVERKSKTK